MKKNLLFALLLAAVSVFAQVPQTINYQAVARSASGNVLDSTAVNVEFRIRDLSAIGTILYNEQHLNVFTNRFGLFTVQIGGGTPVTGNFGSINWGSGAKFLEVLLNGTPMGVTQMVSVPYALRAATADNINDADADPANEIQSLSITADSLSITAGNTVALPKELPSGNKKQTLHHNGTAWVANDYLTVSDSMISVNQSLSLSDGFFLAYFSNNNIPYVNVESYIRMYPDGPPASRAVTLSDGTRIGQVLVLTCHYNIVGGNGVRLTSGGNLLLNGGGSYDMYVNDNLMLIWNGVKWTEISRSNN